MEQGNHKKPYKKVVVENLSYELLDGITRTVKIFLFYFEKLHLKYSFSPCS